MNRLPSECIHEDWNANSKEGREMSADEEDLLSLRQDRSAPEEDQIGITRTADYARDDSSPRLPPVRSDVRHIICNAHEFTNSPLCGEPNR